MCVYLSVCAHSHTLIPALRSPYSILSPVLVSTSWLLSCQCLCELLGSYCGCVSWGASVMCLCVCLSVYLSSLSCTRTYTIQPLHHAIACPRRHFFVIVLSVPLRAPGLVLWLCIVGCISEVSVCVYICLYVFIPTHSYLHHAVPTLYYRLSSSALLGYCLVNASASSWARTVAVCRGVHQ